jgi:hypothetical protein
MFTSLLSNRRRRTLSNSTAVIDRRTPQPRIRLYS